MIDLINFGWLLIQRTGLFETIIDGSDPEFLYICDVKSNLPPEPENAIATVRIDDALACYHCQFFDHEIFLSDADDAIDWIIRKGSE